MPTRVFFAKGIRILTVMILILAAGVATAAQREHSGTESFAAPDGTRVVIDTATVDIRLQIDHAKICIGLRKTEGCLEPHVHRPRFLGLRARSDRHRPARHLSPCACWPF